MTAHRNADDLERITKLQANLRANLRTIHDGWPHMHHPVKAITYTIGGSHGPKTSTPGDEDNGDHNRDVDPLDVLVSTRADITAVLNGWCRVIMEDFNVTHTLPNGLDVPGMCTFLERWTLQLAEHEASFDADDEIRECAQQVERARWSSRRDWTPLGECPVVGEDGTPCGGTVRGYADPSREPECKQCGTREPIDWWERAIFGPDLSRLKTATELVEMIRQQTGKHIKPATVRKWRERGWINPAMDEDGQPLVDDRGSFLYDGPAAMFTLAWFKVA